MHPGLGKISLGKAQKEEENHCVSSQLSDAIHWAGRMAKETGIRVNALSCACYIILATH